MKLAEPGSEKRLHWKSATCATPRLNRIQVSRRFSKAFASSVAPIDSLITKSSSTFLGVCLMRFLADLCFYIGQAARGAYIGDSRPDTAEAQKQLRAYNEMNIVVATELAALLDPSIGSRSDADLLQTLHEWAEQGDCDDGLGWAISKALSRAI